MVETIAGSSRRRFWNNAVVLANDYLLLTVPNTLVDNISFQIWPVHRWDVFRFGFLSMHVYAHRRFCEEKSYSFMSRKNYVCRDRHRDDMGIRTWWNVLLWLPHMTSRANLTVNGKMSMAFPGFFFISFSRHFTKISAFSDCTMANCSNMLKWNVGPMSFLSWNHRFPKEIYCRLFFMSIQRRKDFIQITAS